MSTNMKVFPLQLKHTCFSVVRLRSPNEIYEIRGKASPNPLILNRMFPYTSGMMLCHWTDENNVDMSRCYFNYEKNEMFMDETDKRIWKFEMGPEKLTDWLNAVPDPKTGKPEVPGFVDKIIVTPTANLVYVMPNSICLEKTIGDGKTYCMFNDLQAIKSISQEKKDKLGQFDYSKKTSGWTTSKTSELMKITKIKEDSPFPIEVESPNGITIHCIAEELMYFHE